MRLVPMIDACGVTAIENLIERCTRHHARVILSGLHSQPVLALNRMGGVEAVESVRFTRQLPTKLRVFIDLLTARVDTAAPAVVRTKVSRNADRVLETATT